MCNICIDWEKQRMTSKEAFRAIGEVLHTSNDKSQVQHAKELAERIIQKEVPTTETNEEADGDWWNATHSED